MGDISAGIKALLDAQPAYARAQEYYDGDVDEIFGSAYLARRLGRFGNRYRLDFAAVPVDVIAERLEIAAVTVPDSDEWTQRLNDDVWDANDLLNELPELLHKTCEFGDSYLIVWPDDDEDTPGVTVDYNSPRVARVLYDEENPRKVQYAVKVWIGRNNMRRLNLYYPDRIERYEQPQKASPTDEGAWKPYTGEDGSEQPVIPNPYDKVPVFHIRNGKPYGCPEHRRAYGAQDSINKLTVSMIENVDYSITPQRYALADPQTDTDDDGGDDFLADDNTTPQVSGNPGSRIKSGPGELWWLVGQRAVGQFDAADMDGFLKPLEFEIRSMAQLTRTPMHYFDPMGDVPSGESLRAANAPLNKRAQRLRQMLGGQIAGALEFALQILGAPEDIHVDIRWTVAEEVEDSDGWNVVLLKIRAGVPVTQALMEAGYTDEQVQAWRNSTDEEDLAQRIEMLSQLGSAVQGLSSGAVAGIIDPGNVLRIVQSVLNPIQQEGEPA